MRCSARHVLFGKRNLVLLEPLLVGRAAAVVDTLGLAWRRRAAVRPRSGQGIWNT